MKFEIEMNGDQLFILGGTLVVSLIVAGVSAYQIISLFHPALPK